MAEAATNEVEGNPEAGNLDRLVDITVPEPVSWWPLAPGWWVVSAMVLLAIVVALVVMVRRWQRNAYRRVALAELDSLGGSPTVRGVNDILKRTALCAYARGHVASLTGKRWFEFLAATGSWSAEPGTLLETEYDNGPARQADPVLIEAAKNWIREHQPLAQERPKTRPANLEPEPAD